MFALNKTSPESSEKSRTSTPPIEYFRKGFACGATDYDCQISNYSKAINLNPNDADAYINRGVAYYNKKEYEAAIRDYNKAIEINPNYAAAYFNRGTAYDKIGESAKAEADRKKYKELGGQ